MMLAMIGVVIFIGAVLIGLTFHFVGESGRLEQARCQAARQTIFDEAELIAAGGKFPGGKITDRWKKLMDGCE